MEEQDEEQKQQSNSEDLKPQANRGGGFRNTFKKPIKSLIQNIKGAMRGNKKDIFVLKVKLIAILAIFMIVITFVVLEIIKDASQKTKDSINKTYGITGSSYTGGTSSGSNSTNTGGSQNQNMSDSAEYYVQKGSLLMATDEELLSITNNFLDSVKNKNTAYYENFSKKYSGGVSDTVAGDITNITTKADTNETVSVINNNSVKLSGEASVTDERTIYEHILRTEKYNFNNIIWRSFVKSGDGGVVGENMSFQVDSSSKLKYPASDAGNTDNSAHDLKFFVSKLSPYLQTYFIPLNMATATLDKEDDENINTKFAYEVLTKGYHEIVMDRYKMETLTRNATFRDYERTIKEAETYRTCRWYRQRKTTKKAGDPCTKSDYQNGYCKDSTIPYCSDSDYATGKCSYGYLDAGTIYERCSRYDNYSEGCYDCTEYGECSDIKIKCTKQDYNAGNCEDSTIEYQKTCSDNDYATGKCTYGTIKENSYAYQNVRYCVDEVVQKEPTKEHIRETVGDISEDSKYRWYYIISLAKLLDNVIANDYEFKAYYEYSTDTYMKFINKEGEFKEITAEEFAKFEEENSKTNGFIDKPEEYYDTSLHLEEYNIEWTNNTQGEVVNTFPTETEDLKLQTEERKQVDYSKYIEDEGYTHKYTYKWEDSIEFKGTSSGVYNVDSVKDVAGGTLSSKDTEYYEKLQDEKSINLIDILNAKKEIYINYLASKEEYSDNIGYIKDSLDLGYMNLRDDLKELLEEHKMARLSYGSSLGIDASSSSILSGVKFGEMENILADLDDSGYYVTYPLNVEDGSSTTLQIGRKIGNSYGYVDHLGIDISDPKTRDDSLCTDYTELSTCPYVRGPAVYTIKDGYIEEVEYTEHNHQHDTGPSLPYSWDGKLRIVPGRENSYGTRVVIRNLDGTGTCYAHLFPDYEFYKGMSEYKDTETLVPAGTFIGYMGNTGNSSALHLHIEIAASVDTIGRTTWNSTLTRNYLVKIIEKFGITPRIV